MAADDLVTPGAKALVAMVLTNQAIMYPVAEANLPAILACGVDPVLRSMNVPVPIEQVTSPVWKQHCPKNATCWSAPWTESMNWTF